MKIIKRIGLLILVAMMIIQISPVAALAETVKQAEEPTNETTVLEDSSEQPETPQLDVGEVPILEEQPTQAQTPTQEPAAKSEVAPKERAVISDNIFTEVQLVDGDGNNLEGIKIDYGSGVVVKLAFSFTGKDYQNGDEFKFTMPDAFNFGTKDVSGDFSNGLAKWNLDVHTREFKITFLKDGIQDGQYDVTLSTAFKLFAEGESTKQQVVFPTKDQDTIFNLEFKPKNATGTRVTSSFSPSQLNPDKVIVDAQFNLTKEDDAIGLLKLIDNSNSQAGADATTIDKSTIAVYSSDVDATGNFTGAKTTLVEGQDYTLTTTDKTIDVQLTNGLAGKGYQVTYEKKVKKPNNNLSLIQTTAQTSGDKGVLSSNYSYLYPKMTTQNHLTKTSSYDSESRTITWKIEMNYDQTILYKDALVKDVLDDSIKDEDDNITQINGIEYVADSFKIKEVTFSTVDGSAIVGEDASADWNTPNIAANGSFDMTYKQNDVAKSYQVEYQTKITDFTARKIENVVQLNTDDPAKASMSIGPNMLKKAAGEIDYFNNEMTWTITANSDQIQMTNLNIEDEFSTGIKELLDYEVYTYEGKQKVVLEEGVDYTLTKGLADLDGRKRDGFLVQLIGPYSTTNKKILVDMTVRFDLTDLDKDKPELVNKARIWYYDKYLIYYEDTQTSGFTPSQNIMDNGGKFGKYNPTTGNIDWVVLLNSGGMNFDKLVFDDALAGKHTLIKDSVRFREVKTSDELTNLSTVLQSQQHLLTDADTNYPTNIELNKDSIHLDFENIKNKRVFVLYSTEPDEKWSNDSVVSNSVKVTNNGANEKIYAADVRLNFANSPIYKTSSINKDADNMIDWKAAITNVRATRDIKDLKIVETLDIGKTGAKFVSNSVKVTNNQTRAVVSPDKYTVTIDGPTMTIQFNDYTMSEPHTISYNTVSSVSGLVKSTSEVSSDSFGSLYYYYRTDYSMSSPGFTVGSGTGLASLGNVTINKVDEDDQTKKLAGATFRLDSDAGGASIEGTTDENGVIQFKDVLTGSYQLVEVKAPKGYELKGDYQTGKPVTITANDADNTFTITNKIKYGEVKLTKKAQHNGENLAGATFEIRDAKNQVVGETLVTDKQGEITASLPPGDYQFIETKAPTGYQLNATPQAFTIIEDQVDPVELTFENEIQYGNIELTKTDQQTGATLAGAVFELRDGNNKVVQTDLTTDKEGKIIVKDLFPGEYQLIETKAPKGYILDQKPVAVAIELGQTELVKVTKTNQKEVAIPKVDPKDEPKEKIKDDASKGNQHTLVNETNKKKLPLTGEQISYLSMGIGIVLLIGAVVYLIVKKRKK